MGKRKHFRYFKNAISTEGRNLVDCKNAISGLEEFPYIHIDCLTETHNFNVLKQFRVLFIYAATDLANFQIKQRQTCLINCQQGGDTTLSSLAVKPIVYIAV